MDIAVIGAGAAGYFAAITAAEHNPDAQVCIFEAARPLAKVRISGGGRCNVTTSIEDARTLISHYPRGSKELLGPFKRFGPRDTRDWFEQRGVTLKTESDGRVFPVSDDSQSIIDCLQTAAQEAGVQVLLKQSVKRIQTNESGFNITCEHESFHSNNVILCCGGNKHGHQLAASLGHTIIKPLPSIFTFSIKAKWLSALSGLSLQNAVVQLQVGADQWTHQGPCLITHWGLSGPAILRLSAFAARALGEHNYHGSLQIDWTGNGAQAVQSFIDRQRKQHGKALVCNTKHPDLPQRLLQALIKRAQIDTTTRWSELSKQSAAALIQQLSACPLNISGKGVFKEEFVTSGGIDRNEIHWRTMQSKICPGLFAAGEILDVDGVTGGFNFQNAWTTAYLAGLGASSGTSS